MTLDKPLNLNFELKSDKLPAALKQSETVTASNVFIVPRQVLELWCIGDWDSLVKLDNAALPDQEDRACLAVLCATGYQYRGDECAEKRCIELALRWGADKTQIRTMLLAGIYNRLGRASVLAEDYQKAAEYFKKSLSVPVLPVFDVERYLVERIERQLSDMSRSDVDKTLSAV